MVKRRVCPSVVRATCILACALAFARPGQAAESLQVAAAVSLIDALPKVAHAWKEAGGADVSFSFDASSRLATQIAEGGPADLFFSADTDWMDFLDVHARLEPGTRRDLLGNALAVVVPPKSGLTMSSLQDLARAEFEEVALAGENVPAGRYARAALKTAGVWEAVKKRVVNGANVRQTLELAAHGEVTAAIVYRTDALTGRVRTVFVLPATASPPIVYPAAIVRGAAHPAEAGRFLAFCQTPVARQIFLDAGFTLAEAH